MPWWGWAAWAVGVVVIVMIAVWLVRGSLRERRVSQLDARRLERVREANDVWRRGEGPAQVLPDPPVGMAGRQLRPPSLRRDEDRGGPLPGYGERDAQRRARARGRVDSATGGSLFDSGYDGGALDVGGLVDADSAGVFVEDRGSGGESTSHQHQHQHHSAPQDPAPSVDPGPSGGVDHSGGSSSYDSGGSSSYDSGSSSGSSGGRDY